MARRTKRRAPTGTAVAYLRVSTAEQVESGAGLEAQRATVISECEKRSLTLVHVFVDDDASGKSLDGRPELSEALRAVDEGMAGSLVVAKLDRLSRSVHDASGILDRAKRRGWSLVAADIGVDTATATGEAMANMMATFAQLERRMIGDRTRDALAAKRAEGVRLGPTLRTADRTRRPRRAHVRRRLDPRSRRAS